METFFFFLMAVWCRGETALGLKEAEQMFKDWPRVFPQ